jgi:hypothetical protein
MLITFQINREASLGLAHRIITDEEDGKSQISKFKKEARSSS